MIVRDICAADRPRWEPLWAGYLAFYENTLTPEITNTTWARFHDPAEPMFALVAEGDDSDLLGFVHCVLHRGTWTIHDQCYLEDLFVAASARGKGVGRGLVEAVYTRADAISAGHVHWLTHESNTSAQKLYDRIAWRTGFIQYRQS